MTSSCSFRARRGAVAVFSVLAICSGVGSSLFSRTAAAASDAAACIGIDDDAARLECYDRALGRTKPQERASKPAAPAATAVPPAVAAPSSPVPAAAAAASAAPGAAAAAAEESFGAENLQKDEPEPVESVDEIEARVTEVVRHPRGRHIIRLDNGQSWQQVDATKSVPADVGDTVKVWRGWFESYYLRRTAGGKTVNVRRIE